MIRFQISDKYHPYVPTTITRMFVCVQTKSFCIVFLLKCVPSNCIQASHPNSNLLWWMDNLLLSLKLTNTLFLSQKRFLFTIIKSCRIYFLSQEKHAKYKYDNSKTNYWGTRMSCIMLQTYIFWHKKNITVTNIY